MAGEAKQVTLTKGTRLYYRTGEATTWEIMARIKDYPGMRSSPASPKTTAYSCSTPSDPIISNASSFE